MSYYYDDSDPMSMYRNAMMNRGGRPPRRFDEYYRCYPIAMMPGPERDVANHGGKMFLPASALEKLTQLHITYPMLFELTNGALGKSTHAGVLEFTAEEGRCYLPYWIMTVLGLDPGDLIQTKSTDLPPGQFIKLQPQNVNFLDITDPKAVLETAFRNFSCLSLGDVFTFSYNDTVYEIAVLELKPNVEGKHAISVQETDLEVDFAPPIGYQEPQRASGTSTPRSIGSTMAGKGGMMHAEGTMAQAINYASIAPSATEAVKGAASINFSGAGQRLVAKKGKSSAATPTSTPGTSTPSQGASGSVGILGMATKTAKRRNGPQPLRLKPNQLFFGYEIKPLKDKDATQNEEQETTHFFSGEGHTLKKKKDAK